MSKKWIARLSGALLVALAGGALASTALAGGGGTNCPDVWNPVICSNGQVYSNLCYAGLAHAHGCVPYNTNI